MESSEQIFAQIKKNSQFVFTNDQIDSTVFNKFLVSKFNITTLENEGVDMKIVDPLLTLIFGPF